jgi:hypothetical protein
MKWAVCVACRGEKRGVRAEFLEGNMEDSGDLKDICVDDVRIVLKGTVKK